MDSLIENEELNPWIRPRDDLRIVLTLSIVALQIRERAGEHYDQINLRADAVVVAAELRRLEGRLIDALRLSEDVNCSLFWV
jgi:hypothetical protein